MNAWQSNARVLSEFTFNTFPNRLDAIGAYYPKARRVERVRVDGKVRFDKVYCLKTAVDRNTFTSHYLGADFGEVRGVYTTGVDGQCRWFAFDDDNHDGERNPKAILAGALAIAAALRKYRIYCMIEDSDGRGGIHVWILFTGTIPAAKVRRFARHILKSTGINAEIFPKQDAVSDGFGNFLRLPGRHHTNDHWSKFWDFDRHEWLDDASSVDAFLNAPMNDPAHVPDIEAPKHEARPYVPPAASARAGERYSEADLVRQCLPYLAHLADSYDSWIGVGAAMKLAGCDVGEWDAWSSVSPAYIPGANECWSKWESFTRNAGDVMTVGSLIYHARLKGARIQFYRRPLSTAARIGMQAAGVSR